MMRKRGKWIAVAVTTAMAMLLGITACSDGDDYSDVGPAPETKKDEGGSSSSSSSESSGTSSVVPTGVTFDGTNGKVVNATDFVKADKKAKPTDADVWTITKDTYIWADGVGDVTLKYKMPDDWDGDTNDVATADSSSPGTLIGLDGTAASSTVTVADDGVVTVTVDQSEIGDRMVLKGTYVAKDGSFKSINWGVPVTAVPTFAFDIAAGGQLQYKVPSGGTGKNLGPAGLGGTAASASDWSATAVANKFSCLAADNDVTKAANGLDNGATKRVAALTGMGASSAPTLTINKPGTCYVVMGYDATNKVKIKVDVSLNGAVTATIDSDKDTKTTLADPTIGAAGVVGGKAVAGSAAVSTKEAEPLWVGSAGAAADVALTFAAPSGYTGTFSATDKDDGAVGSSVSAGTNSITAAGSFVIGSTHADDGPFTVKFSGFKSSNGKLTTIETTKTIYTVAWPTLALALNTAKTGLTWDDTGGTGTAQDVTGVVFGTAVTGGGALIDMSGKVVADVATLSPNAATDIAIVAAAAADAQIVAIGDGTVGNANAGNGKILKGSTDGATYKVYQATGTSPGDYGDPIATLTITISAKGEVGVTGVTAFATDTTKIEIAQPTVTTKPAVVAGEKVNASTALSANTTAAAPLWLGDGGGDPAAIGNTVLTFADSGFDFSGANPAGPDLSRGDWSVQGLKLNPDGTEKPDADGNWEAVDGTGSAMVAASGVLTIGPDEGHKTLRVTYTKLDTTATPKTLYTATYDLHVVAWPTVELGIVTTEGTSSAQAEINGTGLDDGDVDGYTAPVSGSGGSTLAQGPLYWRTNHPSDMTKAGVWQKFAGAQNAKQWIDSATAAGNAVVATAAASASKFVDITGSTNANAAPVFKITAKTADAGEDVDVTPLASASDKATGTYTIKVGATGEVSVTEKTAFNAGT